MHGACRKSIREVEAGQAKGRSGQGQSLLRAGCHTGGGSRSQFIVSAGKDTKGRDTGNHSKVGNSSTM